MSERRVFIRTAPGPRETVVALAVAAGIGIASFYVTRALLSRESTTLSPPTKSSPPGEGEKGSS